MCQITLNICLYKSMRLFLLFLFNVSAWCLLPHLHDLNRVNLHYNMEKDCDNVAYDSIPLMIHFYFIKILQLQLHTYTHTQTFVQSDRLLLLHMAIQRPLCGSLTNSRHGECLPHMWIQLPDGHILQMKGCFKQKVPWANLVRKLKVRIIVSYHRLKEKNISNICHIINYKRCAFWQKMWSWINVRFGSSINRTMREGKTWFRDLAV